MRHLAHAFQHLQILDHQLARGADTQCLRLCQLLVHAAQHRQHETGRLPAAVVRLPVPHRQVWLCRKAATVDIMQPAQVRTCAIRLL